MLAILERNPMLNTLPHEPEAAHALIQQKLNEHTEELREVRKENVKQNEKLKDIVDKLDTVKRQTGGILEVVNFTRNLCRLTKLVGKFVMWAGGVATGLGGLWKLGQWLS